MKHEGLVEILSLTLLSVKLRPRHSSACPVLPTDVLVLSPSVCQVGSSVPGSEGPSVTTPYEAVHPCHSPPHPS